MTWNDWIPALSTTTILGILGFVAATLYKAAVERGIQHKFEQKLEELKAKLRRDEELFRAELRAKDDQITALRQLALSSMAIRREALSTRRLEAVEKLWKAVIDHTPLETIAEFLKHMKMGYVLDSVAKQGEDAIKLQKWADFMWNSFKLDEYMKKQSNAERVDIERPFVSPMTWALFSAYRAVLSHPLAQLMAVRTGVGGRIMAEPKATLDLVKSALPHQERFIEKHGTSSLPYLVDELKELLLATITKNLEGEEETERDIERAAEIIAKVKRIEESQQTSVEIPDVEGITSK